ncbi:MAG: hypothetical protein NZ989_08985, partial [Bacteroidia bacterium]|nr:hypothetical protein [Bacteroidia bacterium]MDW8056642.1 hypothetical protein [Bacteroidia bacterium]
DHRSDIYSLGVVLYEALVGRPPYPLNISEFDLSLKIVQEPIFDLSRPPAGIPARLLEVILRATEKQPDYRYASCAEFLRSFEEAFKEEVSATFSSTQVYSGSGSGSPSKKASKNSKWLWIGALIGLVAGGGAFWWLALREPPSSPALSENTDTTGKAVSTLPPQKDTIQKSSPAAALQDKPASQHKRPSKESSSFTSAPIRETIPSKPAGKAVIQTEIQNFKEGSLIHPKAKGMLMIRNIGNADASPAVIAIHFLNKKGAVEYTDTLRFEQIKAGESMTRSIQARVNGIKSLRVEVLFPRP